MSTRPIAERAVLFVFGLIVVLLADAFALQPHQLVQAAAGADAGASLPTARSDALICPTGFGDTRQRADMSLHGVAVTDAGALAVGFSRRRTDDGGQRRPAALYTTAGRWTRAFVPSPGAEDGLIAVASNGGRDAWAVGFTTFQGSLQPLAMRWNGREWNVNKPGPRGELASMLTDVTVVGGGDPFVVGYRMTASGKRKPLAARIDGTRWRYLDPRAGKRESVSLSGIAPDRKGGLWVVGHGGRGAVVGPVIYRRADGSWKRMKTPDIKGEAVLTDVVALAGNDAWAVGYQRKKGRSTPLVLHWGGKRWQRTQAPEFTSEETLLTAISAPASGGIWVVGSGWNRELERNEALAAWWDGQAWNSVAGPEGGDELHDVTGSLENGGWAVGRAGKDARATRVCVRPQASIFGGSEPFQPVEPLTAGVEPVTAGVEPVIAGVEPTTDGVPATAVSDDADGASVAISSDTDPDVTTALATPDGDEDDVAVTAGEAVVATTLIASNKKNGRKNGKSRQKRRSRRPAARNLPAARADALVTARDVATQAGVAGAINSYGAVAADFDGDGDQDLYIGGHGRPGRLVLNDDGLFTDHAPMLFPQIDRHGCAAADVDGSGLPDLYCTIGGRRGSGLKTNELWIDPGGPEPVNVAVAAGVADPTGRGRESVFLSAGKNDPIDLVVTNSPTRVDGLPSIGRLYRSDRDGDAAFSTRARVGFAPRLGALSVQDADFDDDGREDLLLVTGGPQAPKAQGTHLYRNTRQGLVEVTGRSGIRSFGEIDAALVDLNRDNKLDLVQLSPTRLRVSIWSKGRFRKVYARALTHGRSIAAGDVNGDGRDDLYIVRGNGVRNPLDVMLVNRNNGRSFSSMSIPQTYSGDGDEAIAIDHDGNGLTDFLVLNGRSERGPTQLVAFYPRETARLR